MITFLVTNHFCQIFIHSVSSVVTLANEIPTKAKGIGQVNPLSFVTLNFVLYVTSCRFNLASVRSFDSALNAIIFLDDSFVMKD